MNLYIRVEDGKSINHPVFEDNLIAAFGSIPSNWEPFVRVEKPIPTTYQKFDSENPTYEKIDGVWTDVWSLRDMTDAEKIAHQQAIKDDWASNPTASNYTSWIFNPENCRFTPPIPYPMDNKDYFWQGTTNTWQIMPPYPTDGKEYKLDFSTGTWVLKT